MPRRIAALLLACLASCGPFSVDHMFGEEEQPYHHHWHEWPAMAAGAIVAIPLVVLSIPLIMVDATQDWGWVGSPGMDGISGHFVKVPAMTVGYIVGLPFLLLGLPWEFGPPPATPPAIAPASRPTVEYRH